MFSKPFKPPLLKKPLDNIHSTDSNATEPPSKKRRMDEPTISAVHGSTSSRPPLKLLQNPPSPELSRPDTAGNEGYYAVLWRKFTAKKHKTWDGDGILAVREGYATLKDESGRDLGRVAFSNPLLPGSTLSVGGREVEVDGLISKKEYLDAKPVQKETKIISVSEDRGKTVKRSASAAVTNLKPKDQLIRKAIDHGVKSRTKVIAVEKKSLVKPTFKPPVIHSTVAPRLNGKASPRHDPKAPGALVMKAPSGLPGQELVDVVVDPLLTKKLREHQRQGVSFLYECVMGLREAGREGCILADDMGLGKTLQTIALLWTLLKQNPVAGVGPVIRKALIVCPVTLINNWQKEFRKWLGNERLGVFVADGKRTRLTDFTMGKSYSVMIIGYERLRTVAEDLTRGSGIDIVIADEGQRLKSAGNKSAQAIQSLNTSKRIILSGTPIQNDLSEFYFMVNFVNDGLLGSYKSFARTYESPILKSRQPQAEDEDVETGEFRSEELAETTSKFILRRTVDVLADYLPPKTEYILFCNPTRTQANIYRHILASPLFQSALGSSESALQLITILKKLCNSPSLLNARNGASDNPNSSITTLLSSLPPPLLRSLGNQASSKIRILDSLLYTLSRRTSEKIVLVSNYTSTLDMLSTLLTSLSLPYSRLDGSTPASKRQSLIDAFNRTPRPSSFAFLLSARAGGLGLNLIGASRLVLFDADWNPAVEEQAMARIHREGQTKACYVYRFLLKGGLEERIWQRQVVKSGLASSIVDGASGSERAGGAVGVGVGTGTAMGMEMGMGPKGKPKSIAQFSHAELRDLFRLDERSALRTHDTLGCPCQGDPYHYHNHNSNNKTTDDDPDHDTKGPSATAGTTTIPTPTLTTSANAGEKEVQISALKTYAHINTRKLVVDADDPRTYGGGEEVVGDEVLMEVLRAQNDGGSEGEGSGEGGVGWVFVRRNGGLLR